MSFIRKPAALVTCENKIFDVAEICIDIKNGVIMMSYSKLKMQQAVPVLEAMTS